MQATTPALRISYAGSPQCWKGVLKVGNKTIWTCPHIHHNRDESTYTNGVSARNCAGMMKTLVEIPDYPAAMRRSLNAGIGAPCRDLVSSLRLIETLEPQVEQVRAAMVMP